MRIIISDKIHSKVMHWVNKANFEVSGFGKCSWDPAQEAFIIHDAVLLKQEGGATHTDIDPMSLSRAQYLLRESPGDLRWWWHSHVKMQAFWSSTDEATIKEIGANGWMIATVFNQKDEYKSAFCGVYTTPFNTLELNYKPDIDLIIDSGITDEEISTWDAEFDANVTKKEFVPYQSPYAYDPYMSEDWEREAYNRTLGTVGNTAGIEDLTQNNASFAEIALAEDAAKLNMTPATLRRIYEQGSQKQINKIEAKLERILQQEENKSTVRVVGPGKAVFTQES